MLDLLRRNGHNSSSRRRLFREKVHKLCGTRQGQGLPRDDWRQQPRNRPERRGVLAAAASFVFALNTMDEKRLETELPADPPPELTPLLKPKYPYPEDTEIAYANHMIVQHMEHEYVISFYQMTTPPNVDRSIADLQKALEASGGLHMRCVGKVAVSNGRMPSVINALVSSFARHHEKHPKPDIEPKTDGGE
jgi:hypothetical protein